jgi:ABC-type transport system involved in cytochrome bd biosynthesis fused ATPase/permease subunit
VQKFAKKLLGKYWGRYAALGDSFLENLQGLTTLKIYQADGARHAAMNREAEHFRKVTMKVLTMQLNSIIVMDVIAYGGAALGIIVAAKECGAVGRALHHSAVGGFLPADARAGVVLPRCHERHGRQRQNFQAVGPA